VEKGSSLTGNEGNAKETQYRRYYPTLKT